MDFMLLCLLSSSRYKWDGASVRVRLLGFAHALTFCLWLLQCSNLKKEAGRLSALWNAIWNAESFSTWLRRWWEESHCLYYFKWFRDRNSGIWRTDPRRVFHQAHDSTFPRCISYSALCESSLRLFCHDIRVIRWQVCHIGLKSLHTPTESGFTLCRFSSLLRSLLVTLYEVVMAK